MRRPEPDDRYQAGQFYRLGGELARSIDTLEVAIKAYDESHDDTMLRSILGLARTVVRVGRSLPRASGFELRTQGIPRRGDEP